MITTFIFNCFCSQYLTEGEYKIDGKIMLSVILEYFLCINHFQSARLSDILLTKWEINGYVDRNMSQVLSKSSDSLVYLETGCFFKLILTQLNCDQTSASY